MVAERVHVFKEAFGETEEALNHERYPTDNSALVKLLEYYFVGIDCSIHLVKYKIGFIQKIWK